MYIRIETVSGPSINFVASKTRVVPTNKQTIPRLELLSALLLSNLITTVIAALKNDVQIDSVTCYTDSRVSLYWIKGLTKEWKPFVQNRVNSIRKLVQWKHCAGGDNPAGHVIKPGMETGNETKRNEISLQSQWIFTPI